MIRRTTWIAAFATWGVAQLAGCGDDSTQATVLATGGAAGQAGNDAAADVSAPEAGADQESEPAPEPSPEPVPEAGPDAVPDVMPEAQPDTQVEAGPLWTIEVADDAPKFKSRAALAVDKAGHPHLAYNIATSADGWSTPALWYATLQAGVWQRQMVLDPQGVSAEFPVIVLDAQDTPHIFFNRVVAGENQVDVFMVSGDGNGTFAPPVNITGTTDADEWAPAVAVGSDAAFNVSYQRRTGNPGAYVYDLGYQRVYGGALDIPMVLAANVSAFSLNPDYAIATGPGGYVYALYCKPADNPLNNALYQRRKTPSGWGSEISMSETNADVWGPAAAVDSDGTEHIVYVKGADWDHKTLYYSTYKNGVATGAQALTTSMEDRSYYLGVAAPAPGQVDIAFARFFPSDAGNNLDILFLHGTGSAIGVEERLTETLEGDESAPSIALAPGAVPWVAFVENLSTAPDGKLYLARRASAP